MRLPKQWPWMLLTAVSFGIAVAAAQLPASATKQTIKSLITSEEALNDRCRGGAYDTAQNIQRTDQACAQRDALVSQLKARGWCWGTDDQYEYQKQWERCPGQVQRASDAVQFDPQAAVHKAQMKQMEAGLVLCSHTAMKGLLMRGVRSRGQLVEFAKNTCGTGLRRFLRDMGTPTAMADAYVNKVISDELDYILTHES